MSTYGGPFEQRALATRDVHGCVRVGLAMSVVILLQCHLWAAGHKQRTKQVSSDANYASALATANRFLQAWQTGDLEAGMVLLSDGVRHAQSPDKFEDFFSSDAVRGFEITRGTSNRGRYRFPVVLVTTRGSQIRRKFSEIVVVDAGKNDWTVDKLP